MTTVQPTAQEKFISNYKTVKEIFDNKMLEGKKSTIEAGIEFGEKVGTGLIEFGGKCKEKIINNAEELMQKASEYQEIIGSEELTFGQKAGDIGEKMVENSLVYKVANWTKNLFAKPAEQE